MSSDDITRKSIPEWQISPSGTMSLGSNGKIVVVEEPTLPALAAMAEAARAEAVQAEAARNDAAVTAAAPVPPDQPRPRRNTLETFNAEMAVLERPLEGDVEYVDDKPPRRWPRQLGAFVAVVGIVGLGGALMMARHNAAVAARAESVPSATGPVVATAVPAAPVAPAPAPAAATAPAPTDDAEEGAQPAVDDASWKVPSRTEWTKTRTKVTQSKHARAGGGKVVYRRTTTTTVRHRHVVKRVSGRR